jgi:hypothetical protein
MRKIILFLIVSLLLMGSGCGKNPLFSTMNEVVPATATVTVPVGTAKWAFDKVKSTALSWSSDAKLLDFYSIGGISVDGKSTWSMYLYSASKQAYSVYDVYQDGTVNYVGYSSYTATSNSFMNYDWSTNSDKWITDILIKEPNFKDNIMNLVGHVYGVNEGLNILIASEYVSEHIISAYKITLFPTYSVVKYW